MDVFFVENILKKSISVLLVTVLEFCSAPLSGFVGLELPSLDELFGVKAEAATSVTCGDNLTWTLNKATGVLNISGTGEMYDWEYGIHLGTAIAQV